MSVIIRLIISSLSLPKRLFTGWTWKRGSHTPHGAHVPEIAAHGLSERLCISVAAQVLHSDVTPAVPAQVLHSDVTPAVSALPERRGYIYGPLCRWCTNVLARVCACVWPFPDRSSSGKDPMRISMRILPIEWPPRVVMYVFSQTHDHHEYFWKLHT